MKLMMERNAEVKQYKTKAMFKPSRCIPSDFEVVKFPEVFNELRVHKQLCDGILHSNDGKTFYVHRIILSASSPYFKALFTNTLKGAEPVTNEVNLDIPGHILELLLEYAYTGVSNVTSENVEQLLPLADEYAFLGVIQMCCKYLWQEFQPENCLGIFRFAKRYFCHDLEEKGHRYICHNFMEILQQSSEFKDLSVEELEGILCDDELNVHSEELVFEALIKWTQADLEARVQHLRSLIYCVRYGLLSYTFFTSVVMNNELILASPKLQDSLYPASVFLAELNSRQGCDLDLNDPLARPRIPYEILFAVGGWSGGSATNLIETYDVRADRWVSVDTDVTPRAYHGLCALDNLIYMIGGFDGNAYFSTVFCYSPVTREWKECACMHNCRSYVSVCSLDDKIYALGGFDGMDRIRCAERYSPHSNQWEVIPSMLCQRSDGSAAALNDKVYIVGGFTGQEVLNSAEVFDPVTNQWTYIPSMTSVRSGVSLVAYRNCLYAIGGNNGLARLNSGERYDPSRSTGWQEISGMIRPRSNFAAAVLDDMIFVIGGYDGSTTVAYVERYDVDSSEWYDAHPMILNRSALRACVLAGLPNARQYSYLSVIQETGKGASSNNTSH